MNDDTIETIEGAWCVVANVKRDHLFGEDGKETRVGTRQFRGGTKVYIAGCYAGTCDGIVCIGLHRNSRKFITSIVNVIHLEKFRPKVAYHPEVISRILKDKRCWFKTQHDTEEWAEVFPKWQEFWRASNKEARKEE